MQQNKQAVAQAVDNAQKSIADIQARATQANQKPEPQQPEAPKPEPQVKQEPVPVFQNRKKRKRKTSRGIYTQNHHRSNLMERG